MNKVKLTNITFLITVIVYLSGGLAMAKAFGGDMSMLSNVLISEAMILAPAFIYMFVTKQNLLTAVRIKKIRWGTFFLLPVFAACIMPFMSFLNSISLLFTKNEILNITDKMVGVYSFPVGIFIMAVLPALTEEICYRGIFYNEYRKYSSLGAVLLSGLLFGLMHMNLNQFVYAFAMGCVFAILVEATGSIISSFVVHFCINSFSTVIMYLTPQIQDLSAGMSSLREESISQLSDYFGSGELPSVFSNMEDIAASTTITPKLVLLIGFASIPTTIAAAALIFAFTKLQGTEKEVAGIFKREKKQNLFSVPLVAAIAICVGYIAFRLLIEHGIITL